jgi:aspartyl-tRNA(Asn)/glutamyl-tRNA(Gln) amidotransferase subunit B
MPAYAPTIGLEVHAELKTRTKMFCDSLNDAAEKRPNVNVCPVCMGHPGTLPVPNRDAIAKVIQVGLALGGHVNKITKFDRKNYFYPDLPKGYQISQYDQPLIKGGTLNGVHIRRIHLEEDTGTLIHTDGASLVDYNRSGMPLMELVTEPDLKSADDTAAFARELQLILRYLGVSDADMENGQMRIEANVSLDMGTKVELKNINSFKAVRDAIAYELKRQEEALSRGEKLTQETRGWDEAKQKTVVQRSKEEAHDYRYFPEPDIPPFQTAAFEPEKLRKLLPELPAQKRARLVKEYGLDAAQADGLVSEKAFADYFEGAVSEFRELGGKDARLVLNYLMSDLKGLMNLSGEEFSGAAAIENKIDPEHFAHLVYLAGSGKLTSRNVKDLLKKIFDGGADPEEILKSKEFHTISDQGELRRAVREAIAENPSAAADYKKGKTASMQFLIGKTMGKLKGRGNPEALRKLFEEELKG